MTKPTNSESSTQPLFESCFGNYIFEQNGVRIEIRSDVLIASIAQTIKSHLMPNDDTLEVIMRPFGEKGQALLRHPDWGEEARDWARRFYWQLMNPAVAEMAHEAELHLSTHAETLLSIHAAMISDEVRAYAGRSVCAKVTHLRQAVFDGDLVDDILAELTAHLKELFKVRRGGSHTLSKKGLAHVKPPEWRKFVQRVDDLASIWQKARKLDEFPSAQLSGLKPEIAIALKTAFQYKKKLRPKQLAILNAAAELELWTDDTTLPYENLQKYYRQYSACRKAT